MAEAAQIRKWIREIRNVRPIADDAIVIRHGRTESSDYTEITLLDTACCIPSIRIGKVISSIQKNDLEMFSMQLNHHH